MNVFLTVLGHDCFFSFFLLPSFASPVRNEGLFVERRPLTNEEKPRKKPKKKVYPSGCEKVTPSYRLNRLKNKLTSGSEPKKKRPICI